MSARPLTGIKVIDFTRVLAGPYCAMLLGDLGADVVKIELPGIGDAIRRQGPPFFHGNGMTYLAANRNKRSLALDLKTERGKALALRLCSQADVLVENFRPDVMPRLGLGFDALRSANPRLVYASISGFGADGPDSLQGAFDLTIQAICGYMSITGDPDGRPIKLGTSAFDLVAGMNCRSAILAALLARASTGRGQKVETSLLESQVVALANTALEYLITAVLPAKHGAAHASRVPHKAFQTADGWAVIGASDASGFAALLTVIGRTDLLADSRFQSDRSRVEHRVSLYEILDSEIRSAFTADLVARLSAAGVMCTAVNTIEQALAYCRSAHRDMIVQLDHPVYGRVPSAGSAVTYSSFDAHEGWTAPPLVGEHSAVVLQQWLGLTEQETAELAASGVI
jgi:crotonobetainyl-CoA:carnitine CoA-transferase CaiB-like acyl-CoA transferase